jgi:hypothetical protein
MQSLVLAICNRDRALADGLSLTFLVHLPQIDLLVRMWTVNFNILASAVVVLAINRFGNGPS